MKSGFRVAVALFALVALGAPPAMAQQGSIGTAGSGYAEGFLRKALPGGFDRTLDRGLVGLELPTGVRGAVVSYNQLEPASTHSWFREEDSPQRHGGHRDIRRRERKFLLLSSPCSLCLCG